MSDTKLQIIIEALNNFDPAFTALNRHLKSIETSSKSMEVSFVKSWKGMAVGLNQGIQLFQQIAGFAEAPIKAYMDSETALVKMGMAMKNQGDFSRAGLADMQDFAAQVQKTTAYEDDATLAIMANLKSYGMSNDEIKLATQAALDLATAKANEGMTVEKASELMGKSYLGISTGLKRVGIQFDKTADKSQLFDSVMKQVEERFGGSAQAELLTYAGQWKQIRNEWQNIQELLGLGLLKTIEAVKVGAGLLGVTFLTAGNAILGILRIVMLPITAIANGLAYLNELAGKKEAAAQLRAFSGAIENAQGSIVAAREDMVKWTSSNYDALKATDKATTAIDAMGKAGKRTQAINAVNAKEQAAILKALTDENKKYFESQVESANHTMQIQILNGGKEQNFILGNINTRMNALNGWYDKQADIINQNVANETVKQSKLKELDADYNSQWNKLANEREEKSIEVVEFRKQAAQSYYTWARKQQDDLDDYQKYTAKNRYTVDSQTYDLQLEYQRLFGKKTKETNFAILQGIIDEYKRTFSGGVQSALQNFADEADNIGKQIGESFKKDFSDMTNALTDFVVDGKSSFSDFANSVIKDLVRIMIQKNITGPLAELGSIFLSGLFNPPSSTPGADYQIGAVGSAYTASELKYINTGVWHGGGGPGDSPRMFRLVPSYAFADAPRFHSGIGPGERAAVIRDDESVLTPGQMKAMGSQQVNLNVKITNNNGSDVQAKANQASDGIDLELIIDNVVAKKMGSFGSEINKTLRQSYGATERLVNR